MTDQNPHVRYRRLRLSLAADPDTMAVAWAVIGIDAAGAARYMTGGELAAPHTHGNRIMLKAAIGRIRTEIERLGLQVLPGTRMVRRGRRRTYVVWDATTAA